MHWVSALQCHSVAFEIDVDIFNSFRFLFKMLSDRPSDISSITTAAMLDMSDGRSPNI